MDSVDDNALSESHQAEAIAYADFCFKPSPFPGSIEVRICPLTLPQSTTGGMELGP